MSTDPLHQLTAALVPPIDLSPPGEGIASVVMDPQLSIGVQPHDAHHDLEQLLAFGETVRAEQWRILGFPGSLDFDHSDLAPLLRIFLNHIGDPTASNAIGVDGKGYEQAVVRFFAEMMSLDPDDTDGYVTTGGSEGIRRGLLAARELLPRSARVYASDQAHYSVHKAAAELGMPLTIVPSLPDGMMDPAYLRMLTLAHERLRPRAGRGPGAVVLATIGTTTRGAYDDVAALRRIATTAGAVYVHADAAAGGIISAYSPDARLRDIARDADSWSVSGHKILGAPVPCGVFLARSGLISPTATGEYVATMDRTLGCSRSGLAALLMWRALRGLGHEGMRQRVEDCLGMAAYAVEQLAAVGGHPQRLEGSTVVTFDRPAPFVVERWHLSCAGDQAHLVAAAHVTRRAIDGLCEDLRRSRHLPAEDGPRRPPLSRTTSGRALLPAAADPVTTPMEAS